MLEDIQVHRDEIAIVGDVSGRAATLAGNGEEKWLLAERRFLLESGWGHERLGRHLGQDSLARWQQEDSEQDDS
jgi:hypothetical protein